MKSWLFWKWNWSRKILAGIINERRRWHEFPMIGLKGWIDPTDIKRVRECYEQHYVDKLDNFHEIRK